MRKYDSVQLPTDGPVWDQAASDKYLKDLLKKSEELKEVSENRLRVRLLESVAKTDPQLAQMISKHDQLASGALPMWNIPQELLSRKPALLKETREERIQRLLPKLSPRVVHVNFEPELLTSGDIYRRNWMNDLWDACTHEVETPFYYPKWVGDVSAQCPHPGRGSWSTWAYGGQEKVGFLAHFQGAGHSQEDFCANTAEFWWYLVAENTETLQIWIEFDLDGPCAYRQNNGDVALWILPSVIVKKGWDAEWHNLQTVFLQERWLNIWLATYSGAVVDGRVPQGTIDLTFKPTPQFYIPLDVIQGQRYIISVDVQIALLNTYKGTIELGEYHGSYPHYTINKCWLKGDCVLCRCLS